MNQSRVQLLLSYDFPPMGGGIARWMGELAKRYPPGSLVVSTGEYPGSEGFDKQLPNRVDRLALPSSRLRTLPGMVSWSRRVAALCAALPVEFTWCGNLKPAGYPGRWGKVRVGIPYGILLHGADLLILRRQAQRSFIKRRAARALLGSASILVGNSTYTTTLCRSLLNQLGIPAAQRRTHTVPLGADHLRFRPGVDSTEVVRRYGLQGRRWLLSVARLTRHKGMDVGIQVLAQLAREHPDLGYAIVGTGTDLSSLTRLATTLGVADRVRFLGDVADADLPAVYNSAEIYLGLSRAMDQQVEGFGISLAEASACGLPIVAGRAGGIPEAVRDGENGLLVDSERPDGVRPAVQSLLTNPDLASRLGAAGHSSVLRYYNWDRVAADLAELGHKYGRRRVAS